MLYRREVVTAAILLYVAAGDLPGQNSIREFWPEVDVYVQHGERVRFILQDIFTLAPETHSSRGNFTCWAEVALRPLLRVDLRHQNDVFRKRFLTFRAGYRYIANLENSSSSPEQRSLAELNARYALPGKFVLSDRNRGEFRFIRGQPFSMRYRNRLGLERDLAIGSFAFTPYVYDEYYFDTRYGAWSAVRYSAGVQVPVGRHVSLEPYLSWRINKQSSRRHTAALGFKLNLYFQTTH
jgi:hypothetical protein